MILADEIAGFILIVFCHWLGGGTGLKWCRVWIIPTIVGLIMGFHYVWWIGVLTFYSCFILRMGYGNFDSSDPKKSFLAIITHDRKGYYIRAIVGFIYGVVAPLPLTIYLATQGHQEYIKWALYAWQGAFVGFLATYLDYHGKMPKFERFMDFFIGASFGMILFI